MATIAEVHPGGAIVRTFSGMRPLAHAEPSEDLPLESQAALRQLALERLMAYGVHHADAVELRAPAGSGDCGRHITPRLPT